MDAGDTLRDSIAKFILFVLLGCSVQRQTFWGGGALRQGWRQIVSFGATPAAFQYSGVFAGHGCVGGNSWISCPRRRNLLRPPAV